MKAGRELDALVAEKIMGWIVDKGRGGVLVTTDPRNDDMDWIELPLCSTDIAAAWQVVEKMRANGWRFELAPDWAGNPNHVKATFSRPFNAQWGNGKTDMHAICLAALRAVGVDLEALDD